MLMNLILVYLLYTLFKIYLNILEINHTNKTKDQQAVILTQKSYAIAAQYKLITQKFDILNHIVSFIFLFCWVSFGLEYLQNITLFSNQILQNVFYVDLFIAINYILSLPFTIYGTFVVDKKFGFSTIDVKTFVQDQVKSIILFLILGSFVIFVISAIISSSKLWWIYSYVVIMAFLVLINAIYPTYIAPLFNKFKPLEDETLSSNISQLLKKAGLNSDGVFYIDASKRDTRLNAFFAGLGKSKRVVLYDTLLKKINQNELLAVLGHELGHFKHNDLIKKIVLIGVVLFAVFALFGNIPDAVYNALHVKQSAYSSIVFFMLFSPIVFFIVTPILGIASRHDEYAADEYAAENGSSKALIDALKKLADENKSYPHSHPLNVIFYHTHPPLVNRLKALGDSTI